MPLDTVGVVHGPAEHLEAAADPEHHPATRGVRAHRPVEPVLAQPTQVVEGGAGAGEDDDVGVRERAGVADEGDLDVGLEAQRVDVGDVADPGQHHHRDPQPRPSAHRVVAGPGLQGERVLGVEPEPALPGQHAEDRAAGQPFHGAQAGLEQPHVAAELVHDVARDQRLVGRVEQGQRAVQGREHSAAVDVPTSSVGIRPCCASPMFT